MLTRGTPRDKRGNRKKIPPHHKKYGEGGCPTKFCTVHGTMSLLFAVLFVAIASTNHDWALCFFYLVIYIFYQELVKAHLLIFLMLCLRVFFTFKVLRTNCKFVIVSLSPCLQLSSLTSCSFFSEQIHISKQLIFLLLFLSCFAFSYTSSIQLLGSGHCLTIGVADPNFSDANPDPASRFWIRILTKSLKTFQ